ncbi:MAG: response regulator [Desulfuromonadaceae bacterium]|nr:response regulator [Desulfuromonadaceae bacterium]MDD2856760.1 response regulator [Desulfuromonadaceae bacterium]
MKNSSLPFVDNDKKGKILIVDDEPISVQTLKHILEKDYEVFMAKSGIEALKIAESIQPDVVLLDIIMPEMDGFEVFRLLHKNPELSDIPVLFITSLNESECEAHGLELGAHDFLTKPFHAPIVRLRVKNHLELKKKNDLVRYQRDMLAQKNEELEAALASVKQLEGIIPICMYCKNIRNDSDSWEQLEKYISEHSEAMFSHGICPDCMKSRFGDN